MNENTNITNPQEEQPTEATEKTRFEEAQQKLKARIEEERQKSKESLEVMREGKGRLRLETPIESGDDKIEELVYDFTEMTGVEYTDAMDSDMNANSAYKITYRQALALFAKAAAKQTEKLDMEDIISKIGMTDAVEGVQLATLFFNASTRAGRLRISKK